MAPLEIEFFGHTQQVISPGTELSGMVSHKLYGKWRIRFGIYCSKDDDLSGIKAEVVEVKPRLKLGPISVFEKREVVNADSMDLKKGESGEINMDLLYPGRDIEIPMFRARHK